MPGRAIAAGATRGLLFRSFVDIGRGFFLAKRHATRDRWPAAPRTASETPPDGCTTGDVLLFQPADNLEAGWARLAAMLEVGGARPTSAGADQVAATGTIHKNAAARRISRLNKAVKALA